MQNQLKIILFVAYFGRLPDYYKAWERSARYNSTIDFCIFTDIRELQSNGNIHVEHLTFQDYVRQLQAKIPFPIQCSSPYKLCDYKPVFGSVFSEKTKGYDFWGYCDIDLVFGDIRAFVPDEVLNQYDRCFIHGHLSLYRNCPEMNELYLSDGPYPEYNAAEAYATNEACYFDEFYGMELKCLRKKIPIYSSAEMMVDIPYDAEAFGKAEDREVYCWKSGALYALTKSGGKRPLLYCHFQKRKMICRLNGGTADGFVILPNRIESCDAVQANMFDVSMGRWYPLRMKAEKAVKAFQKYGIHGSLAREKRRKAILQVRTEYKKQNKQEAPC